MEQICQFDNSNVPTPPLKKRTFGYENKPLGFRVYDGNVVLSMTYGSEASSSHFDEPVFYTSTDGFTWTLWQNPLSTTITIQSGKTLYVKGSSVNFHRISNHDNRNNSRWFSFSGNGKVDLVGQFTSLVTSVESEWKNPMSITDVGSGRMVFSSVFRYLFYNETHVYNASDAHFNISQIGSSANTNYSIYTGNMFESCTNLLSTPQWDVQTSVYGTAAFISMYTNCTNLKTAVIPWCQSCLSADRSIENMFSNCTSLETVYYKGDLTLKSGNNQSVNIFSSTSANATFYNYGGVLYDNSSFGIPSTWIVINP